MNLENVTDLLVANYDEDYLDRVQRADAEGWKDIEEFLRVGYAAHLSCGGLLECAHCHICLADQSHPDRNGDRYERITAHDGIDSVVLCEKCYAAAVEAREKIVVHTWTEGKIECEREDDSALSEAEKDLAGYLDSADQGHAKQARDLISSYPRSERRQLHCYQDDLDWQRSRRGKRVTP